MLIARPLYVCNTAGMFETNFHWSAKRIPWKIVHLVIDHITRHHSFSLSAMRARARGSTSSYCLEKEKSPQSDLCLRSDSIIHCQSKKAESSHSINIERVHVLFVCRSFIQSSALIISKSTREKKRTEMLEVEITQQRSIHTTKWEIVLGKYHGFTRAWQRSLFMLSFASGMSLYQVIKLLKQNDDQIKSVTLVYNDKVEDTNSVHTSEIIALRRIH